VLVRIRACGVCHTDLHAAEGDWPVKPKPPFIPGHEGVGQVAAVGAGVRHVKEGDRIGVPWLHTACGHCEHCLGGWETLCEQQQNTGYSVNGGFAEYALADADYVGRLPGRGGLRRDRTGAVRGCHVYKGLKVTDTRPGNWVVISGIGGLGHMAVQYAKAMGLNVGRRWTSTTPSSSWRGGLGATVTVNAKTTDPGRLPQAGDRRRARGAGHGRLAEGVRAGRRHGAPRRHVSLNGLPPGQFPLDIFGMVLNGITVRGSIVGTRLDLQESLDFAAQGKVRATVSTDAWRTSTTCSRGMRKGAIEGRVVLDMGA
jgi:propanol-preferring alcohol dehydrogenase